MDKTALSVSQFLFGGFPLVLTKREEEAVESLAAEIRDVQERSGDREECMMKREKRRKESGNLVQLGEKELYLS